MATTTVSAIMATALRSTVLRGRKTDGTHQSQSSRAQRSLPGSAVEGSSAGAGRSCGRSTFRCGRGFAVLSSRSMLDDALQPFVVAKGLDESVVIARDFEAHDGSRCAPACSPS